MKGTISISRDFFPYISSPSRARAHFFATSHNKMVLFVFFLILQNWFDFILFSYSEQEEKKPASTIHYKLQNPSFFLCPSSTGDFQAALFAALLSTLEHLEVRSALFSNKTFQVPKNLKLTSYHIIFKLYNWEHAFQIARNTHYEEKQKRAITSVSCHCKDLKNTFL